MSGHRAAMSGGATLPSGFVQACCDRHLMIALNGAVEVDEGVRGSVLTAALVESVATSSIAWNLLRTTATEKVTVEVLAEGSADEVKSDGVDAGVEEAHAEANNAQGMPEVVVLHHGIWIQVEPHHEHVVWQEANDEDHDE
jgi:hypothetical protein